LAYDSPEGREFAAGLTSLMTAAGYRQSARMARAVGTFDYFTANCDEMLNVIKMHLEASQKLPQRHHATIREANEIWLEAHAKGCDYGYRNSQISALAPRGTIGFMMDCDTTGIEPSLALTQHKKLVGGGYMKIPTRAIPSVLTRLGYNGEAQDILDAISKTGEIPDLIKPQHRKIFQTAIGKDQISTEGHLLMMASVQPFLSGGISKTVNMANSATVGDVANVYMRAWELGLKCVAIYRDGCKASQPTSASEKKEETKYAGLKWGERKRLPDERPSTTHKFSVGGQDGYLHLGLNDDGTPGEIFINISKAGSTLHGLIDMAATAISLGLQYGVPMGTMLEKFRGMRFEPSGFTGNKAIPRADSLADYLAKWLELRESAPKLEVDVAKKAAVSYHGAPCSSCGNLTVRAGTCWCCPICGTTTGCG